MTTKKLLAGVAFAALLSGGALAQDVTLDGGTLNGQTVVPEIDSALSGTIIIDFTFDQDFAAFGAGGVANILIELNNATLNGVFNGAITTGDANCDFGTPSLGGAAGGASVTYISDGDIRFCGDDAGNDDPNTGTLTIPVNVTDPNSPVSIDISFAGDGTDDGTFVGSVVSLDVLEIGDQSITFAGAAGLTGSGLFDANGVGLTGSGLIAVLSVADLPDNDVDLAGNTLVDLSDLLASAEVTLTFPSGTTGLGTPTHNGAGAGACAAPDGNTIVCDLDAADLDGLVDGAGDFATAITFDIVADGNPLTSITAQTPTISVAVTSAAGFDAAASDLAATAVAPLEIDDGLDTSNLGAFEWVRFGSGGTESNFRIQLADAAEAAAVTKLQIVVGAEGNGITADTYDLAIGTDADTEARVQGSTITFNSRALGAAAGATGNADIGVTVVFDEDVGGVAGSPINRQLVNRSPGSFVATPGLESDN